MKTKQAIKIINDQLKWRANQIEFRMPVQYQQICIAIDHAIECMRIVDTLNKPKFHAALHEIAGGAEVVERLQGVK